jgi:hypothetical protein
MNVTNQLPEIYLLIADDRMITVLKEIAMSKMAKVVGYGVPSKKTPHEFRETQRATS